MIRLNPGSFEFKKWNDYNYYLYLICEDESVSKKVQKLDMQDDKYERIFQMPRLEKMKLKNQTGSGMDLN